MNETNATRAAGSSAPDCSPFLAGCEAFRAGVVVGDNPHDDTTDAHWRWMAGWVAAGEAAQADFTNLPFPSDTFALVVFNPPHIEREQAKGLLTRKYGNLTGDWREMLRLGFAECFRVLRPEGTLIFKWAESDYTVREILALTPARPLFGHQSGKFSKTHWIAFLKPNAPAEARRSRSLQPDVGKQIGGTDHERE